MCIGKSGVNFLSKQGVPLKKLVSAADLKKFTPENKILKKKTEKITSVASRPKIPKKITALRAENPGKKRQNPGKKTSAASRPKILKKKRRPLRGRKSRKKNEKNNDRVNMNQWV